MKKHSPGFLALVEDARSRITETDVDTVRNRMEAGDRFHLVDVREDSEWARGHLPGAVHLGRGILERDVEKRIPDHHAEIVLYCGGGFRSALAADSLQRMGYARVRSMDGGYTAWVAAGGSVERSG
jgi:rhodanese-related sulfurtransferase